MRLFERMKRLIVQERLTLPFGSKLEVYGARGTKTTLSATELSRLDAFDDELALLSGLLATSDEINRVADVSTRIVTHTATGSITLAANDGKINLLGDVGGDTLVTLTLPAAAATGARFRFIVSVVNTSNYVIKVANASDTIDGVLMGLADGGDTVVGWETASDTDTITLNGSTTGGASIGDWVELVDIATNQWAVAGQLTQTGSEATPFSAGV